MAKPLEATCVKTNLMPASLNLRHFVSVVILVLGISSTNTVFGQCGQNIDLSTWVEEGDTTNGEWTVGGGGSSVAQTINGDPTFLVSPDSFINVIITGRIRVNTTNDDDWVGFVFGYQDPDTLSPNYYDFYLFDWKQADQNFSGFFGAEGYSLSRMQGNITNLPQAFAGKQGPFCNLIASDFGNTKGWNDLTNYDFALTYTNTRTVISINGDTIFDVYGCFGPGRFGFYNYSQSDVIYSNFSYRVAASFEVVTPDVCAGDSAFIRAISDSCVTNAGVQVNNTIVAWNWDLGDGTTSNDTNVYHVYSSPGVYNVRLVVTDYLGCTDTAYNDVTVHESTVDLGASVSFCADSSITLDAGVPGNSYLWNTGDTTQTITVSSSGNYAITMTSVYGCESSDTVAINVFPVPTKELPNDTAFCDGNSLILDAGNAGSSFFWNNGQTTQTLSVDTTGQYIVTITSINSCSIKDTFELTVHALPIVDLGPDTSICQNDIITLNAGNAVGASFAWQSGATTQTQAVSAAGSYQVTVTNTNLCQTSDTIQIGVLALPVVSLGNDTSICDGDTLIINAQNITSNYSWQNGSSNQTFNATAAGNYSVTVTDTNTCSNQDTLVLGIYSLPIVNLGNDTSICDQDTLMLDAQNPTATFVWQNGSTNQTFNATVAGNYRVTVTDTNTCQASDNINLGIFSLPIVNLGPDTSICDGDSYALNALNPGASYLWQDGSTSQTYNASLGGTYSVTVTDNNTCSNDDAMLLSINPLPVLTIQPSDTSICIGESVVLHASGNATIVWLNGVAFFPNGNTSSLSPTTTTNYTIQGTDNIGCTSYYSTSIIIMPLPTIGMNLPTDTICKNDTVQATATGAASYSWTNSAFMLNSTGATNEFFPAQSMSFEVTGTDTNGCVNSFDTLIHVNPLPQILLTPFGDDLCIGESTVLTASGAESYTWSPSNFITYITDDTVTITPNDTITYTVTGIDNNQCVNDTDVTINVTPLPVISITMSVDTVCTGMPSIFYVSGANTYNWGPSTNLTGATSNAPTATPTSTTTYNVTATGDGGCLTYGSTTINVFPIPTISAGNDTAICRGDSLQLHAFGGVNYLWNNSDKLTDAHIANPLAFPTAGTFYRVTVTDIHNCNYKDYVFVDVNDKPTASAGDDLSVCPGDSIQIGGSPTGTQGTTFSWSPANQVVNSSAANPLAFASANTTFKVVVTNQFGCKDSSEMELFLLNKPTVELLSVPDFVCKNDSGIISVTPGFSSYNFTPAGLTKSLGNGKFEIHSDKTVELTLKATDLSGCWDRITIPFNVKPLPEVSAGTDKTVCFGDTATIKANGDVLSFTWNNQATLESPTERTTRAFPSTTTTYTVAGTDSNGCIGKDEVKVRVHALPVIDAGNGVQDCELGVINLGGDPTGPENASYSWWPVDYLDNPYLANPTAFVLDSVTFYLEVKNEFGCKAMDSVVVVPDCYTIYAPNAFTPDGDGINDVFMVKGFRYVNPHLEIYDRWGHILFQSDDFYKGWDGNDAASYPCPIGTYFWSIYFQDKNGRNFREEGRVSIVR